MKGSSYDNEQHSWASVTVGLDTAPSNPGSACPFLLLGALGYPAPSGAASTNSRELWDGLGQEEFQEDTFPYHRNTGIPDGFGWEGT